MRPANLLVICSDQHNPRILGASGDQAVATPNLDALARSGTRFASAYAASPICVPARAAMATGRYVHQTRNWDNASPYTGEEAASWGHRLVANGQRVTTIGKLHYRRPDDATGFPEQLVPMHVLDGTGDLYPLLRGDIELKTTARDPILEAGPGGSEYTRYDEAIAARATEWLRTAPAGDAPWALFVSFTSPHFPLRPPARHFQPYADADLPLPTQWEFDDWPRHPALEQMRRLMVLDTPFDAETFRRARAAYYGLVSFLDEQVGRVLAALRDTGLDAQTRVVYTSDHGDSVGAHGLWHKCTMYEESVGVPLVLAGPDVPAGRVVRTNASHLDVFPTVLEAVGAPSEPEDADLPGRSLWQVAHGPDQDRVVFSEYHANYSTAATYMVRDRRYKYVHHVGFEPQLFDLVEDPHETRDLAGTPDAQPAQSRLRDWLHDLLDPEATDAACKADAARKIDAAGGIDAVRAGGIRVKYSPAPREFDPEHPDGYREPDERPVAARAGGGRP